MDLSGNLIIVVNKILPHGLSLQGELACDFISSLVSEPQIQSAWTSKAPAKIDIKVEPEQGNFRVEGVGKLLMAHPCVKCLDDVVFEVALKFFLNLVSGHSLDESLAHDKKEIAIESFDLESDVSDSLVYFQNGKIDLAEIIREQLFLELPAYPHCEQENAVSKSPCTFVATPDTKFSALQNCLNRVK